METIAERAKEFAQNFNVVSRDMDCGSCYTCTKCEEYKRFVRIVTKQREKLTLKEQYFIFNQEANIRLVIHF